MMNRLLAIAAVAASFAATGAFAQLKPPANSGLTVPAAPVAPPIAVAPPADLANGTAQKEQEGKLAAAGWLLLLDRRDWGTAWETSANMFRGSVPLAAWMDGIPQLREPMGRFVERSAAESVYKTTLAGHPDGEYVSVIFQTKFDKREVEEKVTTVRDTDGRWRVTGYEVR